jgi:hypothetical protein
VSTARPSSWFLAAFLFVLPACDDEACVPGEPCVCNGGSDCYLYCDEAPCVQDCYETVHCGGVCQEDCTFECRDMNDCSTSCGDNCNANCHNVVSCEAIQGANSTYRCAEADRCGARVGSGSSVLCSNLGSCIVRCEGPCDVECDEVGRPCEVYCGANQTEPRLCNSGTSCGC